MNFVQTDIEHCISDQPDIIIQMKELQISCPYGYYIDLDFLRIIETIRTTNLRCIKGKLIQKKHKPNSVETMLSFKHSPLLNEYSTSKTEKDENHLCVRKANQILVEDSLNEAVNDFEKTLYKTTQRPAMNKTYLDICYESGNIQKTLQISTLDNNLSHINNFVNGRVDERMISLYQVSRRINSEKAISALSNQLIKCACLDACCNTDVSMFKSVTVLTDNLLRQDKQIQTVNNSFFPIYRSIGINVLPKTRNCAVSVYPKVCTVSCNTSTIYPFISTNSCAVMVHPEMKDFQCEVSLSRFLSYSKLNSSMRQMKSKSCNTIQLFPCILTISRGIMAFPETKDAYCEISDNIATNFKNSLVNNYARVETNSLGTMTDLINSDVQIKEKSLINSICTQTDIDFYENYEKIKPKIDCCSDWIENTRNTESQHGRGYMNLLKSKTKIINSKIPRWQHSFDNVENDQKYNDGNTLLNVESSYGNNESSLCLGSCNSSSYVINEEIKISFEKLNKCLISNCINDDYQEALSIVQQEWFKISSTKNASVDDVTYLLQMLQSFSQELFTFVLTMFDSNGNSALHYSVSHGNAEIVNLLLSYKNFDINKPNYAGYTCCMLQALSDISTTKQKEIAYHVFKMSDINMQDKQHGQTALMLAANNGRITAVQLLCEAGADVNIQDYDGSTAIMCAVEHGYINIVEFLSKQKNCNLFLKDKEGSTALDIALENEQYDIALSIYVSLHRLNQNANVLKRQFRQHKQQNMFLSRRAVTPPYFPTYISSLSPTFSYKSTNTVA